MMMTEECGMAECYERSFATETNRYEEFLKSKMIRADQSGFSVDADSLNGALFPFQRDIVMWAMRVGRAAIFADCGLGKTLMQLEWARHVSNRTRKPVLIFAPLAVAPQTIEEGRKFGIEITAVRHASEISGPGVYITNYQKAHHFTDASIFGGVVLDESAILKGLDGKTRRYLTQWVLPIPYRLACTATPAPNDYMELGSHAEFLGVCTSQEMLAMFFIHDGGETSKWRLKGHAVSEFWKWVCSFAVAVRKPSDLGYDDGRFLLPKLHMHQIVVESAAQDGYLFPVEAGSLQERQSARRNSIDERVAAAADLVNGIDDYAVVWCNLNPESEALTSAIVGAVEITGSMEDDKKESALSAFSNGQIRRIVSKPTIAGYGLNWQHCAHMVFVGLSDSYEQLYQAIRRCWRFGQAREVHCYIVVAETEGAVVRNIQRKEQQAMEMMDGMVEHMREEMNRTVRGIADCKDVYSTEESEGGTWKAWLGDTCERIREIPDESVAYQIYSPPFASLYTYSNSPRDIGNAKDQKEFWKHMRYIAPHLYRILEQGCLMSFHCMMIPLIKERDGVIGLRDFRGRLIAMFERFGFIFHSEVTIWKDPVTAMQRTKAIGLLYKQLKKDSRLSRQGIADYLVTMRKPGDNGKPVTKTPEGFPVSRWQRYASPVWMDIDPNDTLQRESAREEDDERHICPLQLQVIERGIELWTNPGDVVFSPFMGIGSEGHVALKMGRKFHGIELKRSYYDQAVANLQFAETNANAQATFDFGVPA